MTGITQYTYLENGQEVVSTRTRESHNKEGENEFTQNKYERTSCTNNGRGGEVTQRETSTNKNSKNGINADCF